MTRKFLSLIAAAILADALTAQADYSYGQNNYTAPNYPTPNNNSYNEGVPETAGPYFRAEAGPSFFSDTHLTHFGVPANDKMVFKTGIAVDAAGGYAFNQNVSADLELGFIGAQVDHVDFFTFDRANYYDMPFLANITASLPLQNGRVVPYIGAGVGGAVAVFDAKNFTTPANPTINGRESTVVLAGQIFAGIRFQLNSRMWLGAGYKYFTTGDPTWTYPNDFKFGIKSVGTHSILFTFLWKF